MAEFEAVFGDSDKARTSANKLHRLQQGTHLATIYASEFRQLAYDVNWGEVALIDQFRCGFRDDVQDLLLTFTDLFSFSEAITQAIRCNNRLFESCQEKKHVDIIRIPKEIPQVLALVDSDTTSSFINQTSVAQHNNHVVIDGRTIVSGAITHETTLLELRIDKHMEKIVLNIISTLHHPVILGLPWLEAHNPIIDWQSKTITFNTQQCTSQEPQAQKNTLSKPKPIKLLEKYKDFADVFEKNKADQLPEHCPYDCPIDLEEGHSPPFGLIYGLLEPELQALHDYLTKNLAKGFV
ncbi:hypothetical protein CY35_17G044700 [Sphagnum magellanicum]|nr:hypothetical protein CY35_17G044700 [Sphagnum magellanicum]